MRTLVEANRAAMKCPNLQGVMEESDQRKGIPHPPCGKAVTGELIELALSGEAPGYGAMGTCSGTMGTGNRAAGGQALSGDAQGSIGSGKIESGGYTLDFAGVSVCNLYTELLDTRRSRRRFAVTPMTQAQLAFILWSAQGVQAYRGADKIATLRPVPSGGARHPFEMYFVVNATGGFVSSGVVGLKRGLYRYAPLEHVGEKRVSVEYLGALDGYIDRLGDLADGQTWVEKAPVVLLVSCAPYRAEWRYREAAHRVMLIDLGHLGQNVMLSAEAVGLGSCCIAAYNQEMCDKALSLDGTDEYVVYMIPVGLPN